MPCENVFLSEELDIRYAKIATHPVSNHVREEYSRPERRALDDIIFDALSLTQSERDAVYEAVITRAEARLKKADSVQLIVVKC